MRIVIPLSLVLLGVTALPAAAQVGPSGISQLGGLSSAASNPGGGPASSDQQNGKPTIAPPAAVPGARARPDSVAPLKGGTNDLPPTEALFDAINRGDIASARDAINRGADLDSTNMLGLTPIELSVDLGRNDISFLLLSLRGAPGSSEAAKAPPGVNLPAPAPAPGRRGKKGEIVAAALPMPPREAAPSPLHAPVLFAGNGGAPIPSAGFLGFDPHQ
jgi:hypothetical protein